MSGFSATVGPVANLRSTPVAYYKCWLLEQNWGSIGKAAN